MIVLDIDAPQNCHECDAMGISDIVGLECMNCSYDFEHRPKNCPIKCSVSEDTFKAFQKWQMEKCCCMEGDKK